MGKLYSTHYVYSVVFIFEGRLLMNKDDSEKSEKSMNTIEITIPNGVISVANKGSDSSDNAMSNMNTNDNDAISKKEQKSNQSETSDSSQDTNSKKRQIIINISEK